MKIGHVHLKVSDLDRAEEFYKRLLGARQTERVGDRISFLSMGSAHHEVALQATDRGTEIPAKNSVGLYHTAFEVPRASELLEALNILDEWSVEYTLVDHGISWAIYTSDPDGNGVEIYLDRRRVPGGVERWEGHSRRLRKREIENSQ